MILQPYYMLDFSASACMFEIRINDYPVIILSVEGQVSTLLPINNAILESGTQQISAFIMPVLGQKELDPNAELKFDIKLFDVFNDFVYKEQFGAYKSESIDEKKIPILNHNAVFQAQVPYRQEAWQNGKKLDANDKSTQAKLKEAYNQIAKMIENKDYDSFRKKIAKREDNIAKAMYLSAEESTERVEGLIQDFEDGFTVMPLPNDSTMRVYGNGKVAALKSVNGNSALYLQSEEKQESLFIDISFYIPEGEDSFKVI